MSQVPYPREVIQVALAAAEGFPFERFVQDFHGNLVGSSFVPTGGTSDGGADGVFEGLLENSAKPTSFLQVSVRPDLEAKIRQTVIRLASVGRTVKSLVHYTSHDVPKFDLLEEQLSEELDVTIRIRDASFIANHVNDNPVTHLAFEQQLSHYASYLQKVGASKLIPISAHVKSPAVYTFLAQEMDRRAGDTTALHAMVDALILWSLEGTDPDAGIFMDREEVLRKISSEIPSVETLIRNEVGPRLEALSKKGNRLIRWHQKEDLFCLPFETRTTIESENASDILLRDAVLANLRLRLVEAEPALSPSDVKSGADVALRALQMTFEKQGLEFAAFLNDPSAVSDPPEVATSITDALSLCDVHGRLAVRLGPPIFQALRGVFYASTDEERAYLRRLSSTYTLLFILNTEPRLMEFFQDMAGDFYLYVGADQILKALSEQYLSEPDQMARNALRMAHTLGATLVLTQPVLEEVVGHFRACDFEFRNHIAGSEGYMDYELSRNVGPIMIRSYLYARLNPDLGNKPKSWQSFVQQFCTYDDLHFGRGEEDFLGYLVKKFHMEYLPADELEDLVDTEDVAALSKKLGPVKSRQELAYNDSLLAHAVYGRRREKKEVSAENEFGYSTWWLTGETAILRHTKSLVEANRGSFYIMRPEFLLNFVSLAPSAEAARQAFASIFPSLLGVRLAKRMDVQAFHKVMDKVSEASELDDERRSTAIARIVNQLKGDFVREYLPGSQKDENAIDVIAAQTAGRISGY